MDSFADYYEVLELHASASTKDVTAAYRRLALLNHPDKNRDDSNATAKFQTIGTAYATLRDPQLRSSYDLQYQHKMNGNLAGAKKSSWEQQRRRPKNKVDPEIMRGLLARKAKIEAVLQDLFESMEHAKKDWGAARHGRIPEGFEDYEAFGGDRKEVRMAILKALTTRIDEDNEKWKKARSVLQLLEAEIARVSR